MRYYRLKGNMKKKSLRFVYSLRTLLALVNLSQGFGVLTQGPVVRPGKNHRIGDGGNSYYSIPESLGLLHRISTQYKLVKVVKTEKEVMTHSKEKPLTAFICITSQQQRVRSCSKESLGSGVSFLRSLPIGCGSHAPGSLVSIYSFCSSDIFPWMLPNKFLI